jgi:hypothetical protein
MHVLEVASLALRLAVPGNRPSELSSGPAMATIVRPGTDVASHSSFAAIGIWIEANDYAISGPSCSRNALSLELLATRPSKSKSHAIPSSAIAALGTKAAIS